jgi:hypothetical protein
MVPGTSWFLRPLHTCATICLDVLASQNTVASLAGTAVGALRVIADSIRATGAGTGALIDVCKKISTTCSIQGLYLVHYELMCKDNTDASCAAAILGP